MEAGASLPFALECEELKILHLGWLMIKAVSFCKGSSQTSEGGGVTKRGKKPLPLGAGPGGRMRREIGVLRVTSLGGDGSAGLTFQKKRKGEQEWV